MIYAHPNVRKEAWFDVGFHICRSPPVSILGTRVTDIVVPGMCTELRLEEEKHTEEQVDSTLGYSPMVGLILAHYQHSRDVRTADVQHVPGIRWPARKVTTMRNMACT